MVKLNLGCGDHHPEGWVNADVERPRDWEEAEKDPDVFLVRWEALPWEDDTFDQIILFLVLNHVPLNEMDGFLSEVERVLAPEGRLLVLEEHYPDSLPEFKINGSPDGKDYETITSWRCYATTLDEVLRPFFPYTKLLWENTDEDKAIEFTDQVFAEGGFLDWADTDGRVWPIKGLGKHSCLIMAAQTFI